MLIRLPEGTVYPVHRHLDSDEFYCVFEGTLVINTYSESGEKESATRLIPPGSLSMMSTAKGGFLMKKGTYHDTRSEGSACVFLEVRPGPFRKSDTQYFEQGKSYKSDSDE